MPPPPLPLPGARGSGMGSPQRYLSSLGHLSSPHQHRNHLIDRYAGVLIGPVLLAWTWALEILRHGRSRRSVEHEILVIL